ncbi:MAG: hypothetical protein ACRYG8_26570 [Janthinobacterium lividum]
MIRAIAVGAVALCLTACAPTPKPQPLQPQSTTAAVACKSGGDAKGIVIGFFALFQDAPECF